MTDNAFTRKNGELLCDGISVRKLATKYGTPSYIYNGTFFEEKLSEIKEAFANLNPLICYSVKSNSTLSLLQIADKNDCGLDIVSGGELFRAQKAGISGNRIVFAGVGKKRKEIEDALRYNIFLFNVESIPEAARINKIASEMGIQARIALRINPDVDAHTHKHITTGKKENKFGIDLDVAKDYFKEVAKLSNIELIGIHCHIGSQITTIAPYVKALEKVEGFISLLKKEDINISVLNMGGGYGIDYMQDGTTFSMKDLAKAITPIINRSKCKLVMEPGRMISGPSGILLSEVTYVKEGIAKTFVIVDAGMTELIRPVLYDGHHEIEPVIADSTRRQIKADIVGPICESGDFLGKDRTLQEMKEGEFLAIRNSGAYGFVMASTYNSRPLVAEVIVYQGQDHLARKRSSYEALVKDENPLFPQT